MGNRILQPATNKQVPLQNASLFVIFMLTNICTIYSFPVAEPEQQSKTVKRGDLEMAGMYFQEDHSGAPGSGGGAMGSVYICGYAGSSPEDFEHGASGASEVNSQGAAEKSSYGTNGQGKGSASAVAVVAKSIPIRKAAHLKAKSQTAVVEAHADSSVKSESPYYLRPHILHMPETVESTTTPK